MDDYLEITNQYEWNGIVEKFHSAHILQSWEWGEIKSRYGWLPKRLAWKNMDESIKAAAQVLIREVQIFKIKTPFKMAYIPRGPLLNWSDKNLAQRIMADLVRFAKSQRVFFLKIDPEAVTQSQPEISGIINLQKIFPGWKDEFERWNWKYSDEQVQFPHSIIIDLALSDEELLIRMKQKTRYNIRLAEKKGVVIKKCSVQDLPIFFELYRQTAERDKFIIRSQDYYSSVWTTMLQSDKAIALIARIEDEPIAGIILFKFGYKCWFFYGMSSSKHREKMPNYLLQWHAISAAKEAGCAIYDLWGAPNLDDANDRLWGVYRFKEGFNGIYYKTIGGWDYIINPLVYDMYKKVLPYFLGILKAFRNKRATMFEMTNNES